MTQDEKKRAVAASALAWVPEDAVIGIGTGSTVNFFIDALKTLKFPLRGAVSSSRATSELLRKARIEEADLNTTGEIGVYFDGADEATRDGDLIKGGGGALTREKIAAAAAASFVCMIDETKLVATLGRFPLPIEVIPMARSLVARRLSSMGALPVWREGVVTDNGNAILDVHGLRIADPVTLETELSMIPGVVTVGLFAARGADVLLIGSDNGVETIEVR